MVGLTLAAAGTLPVATHTLEPGTVIVASDVRWVDIDSRVVQGDTWSDPVGRLVVERVLGGEPVRAERLLDPDKPERFAPLGLRVLRVPGAEAPDLSGAWVDVRAGDCSLLSHVLVLGAGKGGDGRVDSWWVLMAPDHALRVIGDRRPLRLAAHDDEVPPCSP
jgi:hypothetical protein